MACFVFDLSVIPASARTSFFQSPEAPPSWGMHFEMMFGGRAPRVVRVATAVMNANHGRHLRRPMDASMPPSPGKDRSPRKSRR